MLIKEVLWYVLTFFCIESSMSTSVWMQGNQFQLSLRILLSFNFVSLLTLCQQIVTPLWNA